VSVCGSFSVLRAGGSANVTFVRFPLVFVFFVFRRPNRLFPAAWLTEEALPVNIPSEWDLFRLFLRSVTIEFEPE
jgi:hypothetical protein